MTNLNIATYAMVSADENNDDGHESNGRIRSVSVLSSDMNEDEVRERLARSRERNREHARRTRLRKKARLQALQVKVKELEEERRILKQGVEECSIASILLGLSTVPEEISNDGSVTSANSLSDASATTPSISLDDGSPGQQGQRKRRKLSFDVAGQLQAPQLKFKIGEQSTVLGGEGKTHINWKSGIFVDENGEQKQLTPEELEALRRERNRMHAKMTRDRKKLFIDTVQKNIVQLEQENQKLREALRCHALHTQLGPRAQLLLSSPSLQLASQPFIPRLTPSGNLKLGTSNQNSTPSQISVYTQQVAHPTGTQMEDVHRHLYLKQPTGQRNDDNKGFGLSVVA